MGSPEFCMHRINSDQLYFSVNSRTGIPPAVVISRISMNSQNVIRAILYKLCNIKIKGIVTIIPASCQFTVYKNLWKCHDPITKHITAFAFGSSARPLLT